MQEIAQGYVSSPVYQVPQAHSVYLGPSTCELVVAPIAVTVLMPRSQNFNEIMPAIYARFMEKEARQWRQIYKVSNRLVGTLFDTEEAQALQLLEYLVKNGSERVVDDARSHIATIKMLRNFYYIDDKGKDQGLNGASSMVLSVHVLTDL